MQYTLLVVDDEEEICSMLKQYFSMSGYIVYTAASAEEALELVSKSPDMIILDVNMPGMDGFELCWQSGIKENNFKIYPSLESWLNAFSTTGCFTFHFLFDTINLYPGKRGKEK